MSKRCTTTRFESHFLNLIDHKIIFEWLCKNWALNNPSIRGEHLEMERSMNERLRAITMETLCGWMMERERGRERKGRENRIRGKERGREW